MTITLVGFGAFGDSNSLIGTTGQEYTPHASTLTDDVMVLLSYRNDNIGTFNEPSGWDTVFSEVEGGGQDRTSYCAIRVATSDSEAAVTVTHTDTGGEQWSGVIMTFRGVDTTTPLDTPYVDGDHHTPFQNKASPNVDPFNEITTVTDGAWILAIETVTHDDITSDEDPSGYTNILRNTGGAIDYRQFQVWYKELASFGADTPGAPPYTSNTTSAESDCFTIALRPGGNSLSANPGAFVITGADADLRLEAAFIMVAGAATEGDTTERLAMDQTFGGGKIGESVAILPTVDLDSDEEREDVWCIEATEHAGIATYDFRVLYEGVVADTITVTPQVTIESGGAEETTLVADAGAFLITGAVATGKENEVIVADAGAFLITGADATGINGFHITADAGAFLVTGAAATGKKGHVLVADAGAFLITGATAIGEENEVLIADAGAVLITGAAATGINGYALTADAGAFLITGAAAVGKENEVLVADAGAFLITGATAIGEENEVLVADAGAFLITGADATGIKVGASALAAEAGVFLITGATALGKKTHIFTADAGAFLITGSDATGIEVGVLKLIAAAGGFLITGSDATGTKGGEAAEEEERPAGGWEEDFTYDYGSEAEREALRARQLAEMPILSKHFGDFDDVDLSENALSISDITDDDDIIAILQLID